LLLLLSGRALPRFRLSCCIAACNVRQHCVLFVEIQDQLRIDCLNGEPDEAQAARSGRASRAQIETQAVCGTAQYAPFQLTIPERRAVVRARVVDRVNRTIDVENHDASTVDEYPLALARFDFAGNTDPYLT
jgi:hypothetical protein